MKCGAAPGEEVYNKSIGIIGDKEANGVMNGIKRFRVGKSAGTEKGF